MKKTLLFGIALVSGSTLWADVLQTSSDTYSGQVVRVENGSVFIKQDQNEIGLSCRDITRIEIPVPAGYTNGLAALKEGKMKEAVEAFKPLADRFAGLPVSWAVNTLVRLGDAYLALKDVTAAQTVFDMIKKLYPNSSQAQALNVKTARLLFTKQNYDEAVTAINAYLVPQLKKDYLSPDQETAVAEALVLLGDCQVATDKPYEALDNYLRVVTLYDYDDMREAEARFKAAQLLEKFGNWKRAKQSYEDLLKEIPDSPYTAAAKEQIEAISKAHKE